jgi:hypothetical protein
MNCGRLTQIVKAVAARGLMQTLMVCLITPASSFALIAGLASNDSPLPRTLRRRADRGAGMA